MEEILDEYEADDDLWAAILTANGSAFCAGADLKEIAAGRGNTLATRKGGFAGLVRRERSKPLIAAIAGSALAACRLLSGGALTDCWLCCPGSEDERMEFPFKPEGGEKNNFHEWCLDLNQVGPDEPEPCLV